MCRDLRRNEAQISEADVFNSAREACILNPVRDQLVAFFYAQGNRKADDDTVEFRADFLKRISKQVCNDTKALAFFHMLAQSHFRHPTAGGGCIKKDNVCKHICFFAGCFTTPLRSPK